MQFAVFLDDACQLYGRSCTARHVYAGVGAVGMLYTPLYLLWLVGKTAVATWRGCHLKRLPKATED